MFLTSTLARGEWWASRLCRFTLGERAPGTHWIGGSLGPRAGLDNVEKRNLLSLTELELQSHGRPALASRYADFVIHSSRSDKPFNRWFMLWSPVRSGKTCGTSKQAQTLMLNCSWSIDRSTPRGLVLCPLVVVVKIYDAFSTQPCLISKEEWQKEWGGSPHCWTHHGHKVSLAGK
jgi:hypothetical protein